MSILFLLFRALYCSRKYWASARMLESRLTNTYFFASEGELQFRRPLGEANVAAAGWLWLASPSRLGHAGHMGATSRSPVDGGCCERSRYHSRVAGLCVVGVRQRPAGSRRLRRRTGRPLFLGYRGFHRFGRGHAQENALGSRACRHRARARYRIEARSRAPDAVTQGPTAAADSRPAGSSKGR